MAKILLVVLRRAWQRSAKLPRGVRIVLKVLLYILLVVVVLYPDPFRLLRHMQHFNNAERLLDPHFSGVAQANRAIDSLLAFAPHITDEYRAVEHYVYQTVRYRYDWDGWGVMDYWPPVEEVWRLKAEDCDGRAILAASILRARGYPQAQLVGNINHMWVKVDSIEIMGPKRDKSFAADGAETHIALPSLDALLYASASVFAAFPALRLLVLYAGAMLLLFHPRRPSLHLAAACGVGISALYLLRDWGTRLLREYIDGPDVSFYIALVLLLCSLSYAARGNAAERLPDTGNNAG